MDAVFYITIIFIFAAALTGIFVNRRRRDRCLRDFAGFNVSIYLKDGRRIWGELEVFSNGLEILYHTPHQDAQGHYETSFMILESQLGSIQSICRFHDELTPEGKDRRLRQIERTTRRTFLDRLSRRFRNFVNTFRDAFSQSIGLLVAQAKKTSPSTLLKTGDKHLTQIGQDVVGATANGYEPMLERYIGRKVVVEEQTADGCTEHPGVLKEYTAGWIEVLDCRRRGEHRFVLTSSEQLRLNRDLDFTLRLSPADGGGKPRLEVRVTNRGRTLVKLLHLQKDEYRHPLDLDVPPGDSTEFSVEDLPDDLPPLDRIVEVMLQRISIEEGVPPPKSLPPLPDVELVIESEREVDLCLPRSLGVVRHGGERL
jgi:hypothetical protein